MDAATDKTFLNNEEVLRWKNTRWSYPLDGAEAEACPRQRGSRAKRIPKGALGNPAETASPEEADALKMSEAAGDPKEETQEDTYHRREEPVSAKFSAIRARRSRCCTSCANGDAIRF